MRKSGSMLVLATRGPRRHLMIGPRPAWGGNATRITFRLTHNCRGGGHGPGPAMPSGLTSTSASVENGGRIDLDLSPPRAGAGSINGRFAVIGASFPRRPRRKGDLGRPLGGPPVP